MKIWRLLAVLLATPHLFAAADLSVVSFTSDKTVAQYAEPVTLMARIANLGPDAATNFAVHFPIGVGYPMSVTAPPGWTCSPLFLWTGSVVCTTFSFPAGAQADFQTTVLVYSKGSGPVEATVVSNADPVASNNSRTINISRVASETQSDLSVTTPAQVGAPLGGHALLRATVRNNGPSAVSNVHLILFSENIREGLEIGGTGAGWSCTSYGPRTECFRSSLAAGETSFVDFPFRSDAERIGDFEVRVIAEKNDDPVADNSHATLRVGFGNATEWKMFLLPLDAEIVEGANGSRWHTLTTMLLRSETTVDVRPKLCDLPIFDCEFPAPPPPPPVNEPFAFYILSPSTLGQYVYVPAADAHKVHANTRTYDASRSTSTGGAEIPFVSEDDFSSSTVSLLGIPLEDANRYTLRVYDADGRGGRVLIHVYALFPYDPPNTGGQESTPRKTIAATLVPGGTIHETTTSALLPIHPATLQMNPLKDLEFEARVHSVRIDIEPLDPGMRLWSFVSITNNETHHVTTVSQQ